jgi:CheY-like chemotaxis protein
LVPEVLDLTQVVSDLHQMLRHVISEDIRFAIVAAPSLGHTNADPGQMEQLLINLAVNARDAMPQGGTLTIATANVVLDAAFVRRHVGSVPGRYVSLSVDDTGCGMTPDVLAHVFEPFFTTKGLGQGTGLGLSTVYGIVKQSGGYITAESRPAVGTIVTIYLPRVDDPITSQEAKTPSVATLKGTETILLVEDDESVRVLMRKMLEEYGYTVLPALDVDDAIAIEARHRGAIHLLVSDIIMPRLNGAVLAQRVVRRRPAIQLLYVSGFANQVAIDHGVISSSASFLQKPFAAETLATKVREQLDRYVD